MVTALLSLRGAIVQIEASRERLAGLVAGADLVFVTTGLGGTAGAAVAAAARAAGALTIGVVSRPFRFEGRVRIRAAEAGIERLRGLTDALVVVQNDRLAGRRRRRRRRAPC